MKHHSSVLVLTLLVLPILLFLSACSGTSDTTIDATEDSVTVNENAEENVMMGGGSRPDSAPQDMPNVGGAGNFAWVTIGGSDMLSFEAAGDYKKVCGDETALLIKAGWQKSDGFEMDVDKAMIRSFSKGDYMLTMTCGDNTVQGSGDLTVTVALNRTKK